MPNITIAVTDTEQKCLEYAAASVQEWVVKTGAAVKAEAEAAAAAMSGDG